MQTPRGENGHASPLKSPRFGGDYDHHVLPQKPVLSAQRQGNAMQDAAAVAPPANTMLNDHSGQGVADAPPGPLETGRQGTAEEKVTVGGTEAANQCRGQGGGGGGGGGGEGGGGGGGGGEADGDSRPFAVAAQQPVEKAIFRIPKLAVERAVAMTNQSDGDATTSISPPPLPLPTPPGDTAGASLNLAATANATTTPRSSRFETCKERQPDPVPPPRTPRGGPAAAAAAAPEVSPAPRIHTPRRDDAGGAVVAAAAVTHLPVNVLASARPATPRGERTPRGDLTPRKQQQLPVVVEATRAKSPREQRVGRARAPLR